MNTFYCYLLCLDKTQVAIGLEKSIDSGCQHFKQNKMLPDFSENDSLVYENIRRFGIQRTGITVENVGISRHLNHCKHA